MKHFLSLLLIFAIALPHLGHAASSNAETTINLQLRAIADYIERTFLSVSDTPLSKQSHREMITKAVDWFRVTQEENGHFRYEYLPYNDEYARDDNIVRQAGALYVLGEVARRDVQNKFELADTIERAIDYFDGHSETDGREAFNFRCITRRESSSECVLGATSLALAGILGYIEKQPNQKSKYADLIESYVTYILKMKKPDTGFRNVHRVGSSPQDSAESSFSNGEALLALVRYYQYNPREDVRAVIDDSFSYLRTQPFDSALYLWIMAALKDMNTLWKDPAYVSYASAYTDWRVDHVARFKRTKRNYCAYTEGIASAYSILANSLSQKERNQLRTEIAYWNNKTATLQLNDDDMYRVIPRDDTLELKHLERPLQALGGFLTAEDQPAERIDFTQHCLSTYIQTLVDIEGGTL